jgi:hypothetical protein
MRQVGHEVQMGFFVGEGATRCGKFTCYFAASVCYNEQDLFYMTMPKKRS